MALNPSLLAEFVGRITAPNGSYPYGSSKDESAPGAGDGTPYLKTRADDIFGLQQALLTAAGLVPTGDADTAIASQYLQGIIQQVLGRARLYDDTGVANAYIVALRTNQQSPGGVFEGMQFSLIPDSTNAAGGSTVDISALLDEAPGTGILDIKLPGGVIDPDAGDVLAGMETPLVYRTSPSPHIEYNPTSVIKAGQNLAVFQTAGATVWDVPAVLKAGLLKASVTVVGGGGAGGAVTQRGGGGGAGGAAVSVVDLTGADTVTVTVGAGGSASAGGTSSFGAFCSATGGSLGGSVNGSAGGAPGGEGTGDLEVQGGSGNDGNSASVANVGGGAGGSSIFGGAGRGGAGAGVDGSCGGGGGGGVTSGGDGGDGVILICW